MSQSLTQTARRFMYATFKSKIWWKSAERKWLKLESLIFRSVVCIATYSCAEMAPFVSLITSVSLAQWNSSESRSKSVQRPKCQFMCRSEELPCLFHVNKQRRVGRKWTAASNLKWANLIIMLSTMKRLLHSFPRNSIGNSEWYLYKMIFC